VFRNILIRLEKVCVLSGPWLMYISITSDLYVYYRYARGVGNRSSTATRGYSICSMNKGNADQSKTQCLVFNNLSLHMHYCSQQIGYHISSSPFELPIKEDFAHRFGPYYDLDSGFTTPNSTVSTSMVSKSSSTSVRD
jgi:hypothetical protein